MIEVIPGINEKTLEAIITKINAVKGLVDYVQIDIMDHTLVQNDTYNNWIDFKNISTQLNLEAHLMVLRPENYIKDLVNNGFKRIITQIEAPTIREFLQLASTFEVEVGISIDTITGIETIEPFLADVDTIQVMTAKMGASGQEFDPTQLFKVKQIHEQNLNLPIAVDNGINPETAHLSIENGAARLISTSFIFKDMEQVKERIEELKGNT